MARVRDSVAVATGHCHGVRASVAVRLPAMTAVLVADCHRDRLRVCRAARVRAWVPGRNGAGLPADCRIIAGADDSDPAPAAVGCKSRLGLRVDSVSTVRVT